jgi:HAD superfamily hydrolase (TIGR01509 family)
MTRALPLPPAALLLDLDGTLVDTEHLHFETALAVIERHGGSMAHEDLLPYVGWAELPFWEDLKARLGLAPPALQLLGERRDACVVLMHARSIEPLPGARELLGWAAARDVPAAVASSSPRALIAAALEVSGLAAGITLFKSGHEDAVHGKPAPDVYLAAAAALGVDPAACVAIEDSPTGARAARASGAYVIAVPCPSHPARPEQLADAHAIMPSLHAVRAALAAPA